VSLDTYRRRAGWLGREVRYYPQIGSTNEVAAKAAREGESEGVVFLADYQTAGRGRLERRWVAPAGSSLLFSILFRPPTPFQESASRVQMVCGLGLMSAVRRLTSVEPKLKWPNDLVVLVPSLPGGWGKLAGMLGEVVVGCESEPEAMVVGIGLNVNVPPTLLADLAPNATSLMALLGHPVDRAALLDGILQDIERGYEAFHRGTDPWPRWRESIAWLGQPVIVHTADHELVGTAVDVDPSGALLLRSSGGEVVRLLAGDVSLRLAGPDRQLMSANSRL